jgi:RimJ/RimL family protein N-acetyltransferase
MGEVALRGITDADQDALFAHKRDPEAVWMAAFTAADPDDRAAFDEHQRRVRERDDVVERAITLDGELVGSIATFEVEGDTELTYWVDRAHWGHGIAGRAVRLILDEVTTRPVFARAAADNAASLRVLAKAGFVAVGADRGYANARGAEIDERVLRLG